MSKRLRKGDEIIVIAGNERGKTGKVISCDEKKVIVQGVNIRKKHMKPKEQNKKGQIIDIEAPLHVSNVRLHVAGAPRKIRARINKNGEKEFYYLEGEKQILYRSANKAPE